MRKRVQLASKTVSHDDHLGEDVANVQFTVYDRCSVDGGINAFQLVDHVGGKAATRVVAVQSHNLSVVAIEFVSSVERSVEPHAVNFRADRYLATSHSVRDALSHKLNKVLDRGRVFRRKNVRQEPGVVAQLVV